jgi:hypothetical protein
MASGMHTITLSRACTFSWLLSIPLRVLSIDIYGASALLPSYPDAAPSLSAETTFLAFRPSVHVGSVGDSIYHVLVHRSLQVVNYIRSVNFSTPPIRLRHKRGMLR